MASRFNTEQFRFSFNEGDLVYKGVHLRKTSSSTHRRRYDKSLGAKYEVSFQQDWTRDENPPDTLQRQKKEINRQLNLGYVVHPQGYLYKPEK